MDDKELMAIKVFLKQLANEYNDLIVLSNGIVDGEKRTQAKDLAKVFRVQIRECDDAVSAGNLGKILENYPVTAKELNTFLEFLQDVPDEI